MPRLHVLHYQCVEHNTLLSAHPNDVHASSPTEICRYIRKALQSLFGDSAVAELLLCHLVSTTYARPANNPICSMPMNFIGVSDSRMIIRMLKALLPKVHVIEITPELLSEQLLMPVMDHEKGRLRQSVLQVSDGTVLVVDETKLSGNRIRVNGHAERNVTAFQNLVVSQRLDYDYVYYQLPLLCDVNVLILSRGASVMAQVPFVVAVPPQYTDGIDPVTELLSNHRSRLIEIRRFLLDCRSNVQYVSIQEEMNKIITDDFVEMRRRSSLAGDPGAALHRLLTLSRLEAAIEAKTEVDRECWKKALFLDSEREEGLKMIKN
ncbi:hypothetical protein AB6A40_008704 [Gnathostoma spinigerum]|uniref:Mini-chromosome maintenance complex-binding protein n=1 Tax=Gnathostoma spinigerum TaxID=75299 RepID=A0ABD6EPU8_9BILA